jgi:hypothetical protein
LEKVWIFFGNFVPKNPENKLKAFLQITIIPIGYGEVNALLGPSDS